MTREHVVAEMDAAARCNLDERGVSEYQRYRDELLAEDTDAESLREILTGFIWDASEEPWDDSLDA